jgi:hypothetical protein
VVDADWSRTDANGDLTLWGARTNLRDLVTSESQVDVEHTGVAVDAFTWEARLTRALDDLEDAAVRTHELFGCPLDERGRYACPGCADDVEREAGERLRAAAHLRRRTLRAGVGLPPSDPESEAAGYDELARALTAEDVAIGRALRARRRLTVEDDEHDEHDDRAESGGLDLARALATRPGDRMLIELSYDGADGRLVVEALEVKRMRRYDGGS